MRKLQPCNVTLKRRNARAGGILVDPERHALSPNHRRYMYARRDAPKACLSGLFCVRVLCGFGYKQCLASIEGYHYPTRHRVHLGSIQIYLVYPVWMLEVELSLIGTIPWVESTTLNLFLVRRGLHWPRWQLLSQQRRVGCARRRVGV